MYVVEEIPADWTDELVADVNAFQNVLKMESDPTTPPYTAGMTRSERDLRLHPPRIVAARDAANAVVGTAWVFTDEYHPEFVFASIGVAPSHRRRGVATMLLERAVAIADTGGRGQVLLGTDDTNDVAETFAASLGAKVANKAHINRLAIADVDRDEMRRWADTTHPDYALEWITPDGPYPSQSMADMAHLRGVLLNDAPMDDIPVQERTVSFEELRADERRQAGNGKVRWTLIARHAPTGVPVGYTEMLVDTHDPNTLYQGATAVDGMHRGHSLGRQLKATMFLRVLRDAPHAREIRTFNADSNGPMLAVNNAMGFQPLFEATRWIIDTKDAREWLDKRK